MKKQIIITIGFFLLVNLQYYLSPLLGILEIFSVLILFGLFLVLIMMLIYHLIKAFKEKFKFKLRNILITCLTITISTTFYKPHGLIDFDNLQGADRFIAHREGAANCTTILKLKEGAVFIENSYCFGTERIKGTYHIENDTIWFTGSPNYYNFGVLIKKFDKNCIELYRNKTDKNPMWLFITKNIL